MKQKILILSSILFAVNVYAQEKNINNTISQNTAKPIAQNVQDKPYTQEQINTLNNHLSKNDYQEFFASLKQFKVSPNHYINFLLTKKHDGIVPVYWLIANHYAKEKNELETHKWLYVSLIMTQQDAYLCKDESAMQATNKLMEFFPETIYLTRNSPNLISQAMREVIFFVQNLKKRIHPEWACYYGSDKIDPSKGLLVNESEWGSRRTYIFNRFVARYQK